MRQKLYNALDHNKLYLMMFDYFWFYQSPGYASVLGFFPSMNNTLRYWMVGGLCVCMQRERATERTRDKRDPGAHYAENPRNLTLIYFRRDRWRSIGLYLSASSWLCRNLRRECRRWGAHRLLDATGARETASLQRWEGILRPCSGPRCILTRRRRRRLSRLSWFSDTANTKEKHRGTRRTGTGLSFGEKE